jgi:hypothetical protein
VTTNRRDTKKYLLEYYTIQIYVYVHIQYIHITINTVYYTKGIIQYPINRMTYEYKIRSIYPTKYNTQQKTKYHILIPKYNTPNNRMTYKYKIRPLYPKKSNTERKTTYHILTSKYNTPKNHTQEYTIRSPYHTKHKLQQKHTNPQHTQSITKPKYNNYTQNQKHVKQHPNPPST